MFIKKSFRSKIGYPNTKYYFIICKCNFCKKKFEISNAKYKSLLKNNRNPGVDNCSRKCFHKSLIYQYCTIKGCDYDPYNKKSKYEKVVKGYCRNHYNFFKKYGDPLYKPPTYICKRCQKDVLAQHQRLKTSRNNEFINYCVDCYRPALRELILKKLKGKCKCCGERHQVFLDIDHIKGGGGKERKKITDTSRYYEHILRNIKKYRILCKNCNWAIHKYKKCIHRQNKNLSA